MIFYLFGLLGYYKLVNKPVPMGICLAFFGMLAVPPVITIYFFIEKHWIFQLMAFAGGMICWTFIEYFVHRFWLHRKENKKYYSSHHFYHHKQPGQIFTTALKRFVISVTAFLLLTGSILYSSYLFLPAGIATGYALYGYMHVWLHKEWSAHWFGRLRAFHMQHHCNQAGKCFGVTVTWWDKIFNTGLSIGKTIGEKASKLYFNDKESTENSLTINHSL